MFTFDQDNDSQQRAFYRKRYFWQTIIILFLVILIIRYCSHSGNTSQSNNPPVVLAKAQLADVPIYIPALGTVTPTNRIIVKTQINGQLLRVLYKDGQMVKAGELIAEIDPRPYLALLMQYEGQLARDQALLANALIDLQRYKTLLSEDSVAKQTYDSQVYLVKQYQGLVKVDQGLIQGTKLNLYYCEIRAPVDGQISLILVNPGNYVQTSDVNGLAIINTVQPITVIFPIAEDNLPAVLDQVNAGKILSVLAYDRLQTKLLDTGTLLAFDNQIDVSTGTIKLKANFPNKNNTLFSNQFVNIMLHLQTLVNATVIPTAAIMHGPQGDFVYIAEKISDKKNKDNKEVMKVHMQPVETSGALNEWTSVSKGVRLGELVVVEGADKITNNGTVMLSAMAPPLIKKDVLSIATLNSSKLRRLFS